MCFTDAQLQEIILAQARKSLYPVVVDIVNGWDLQGDSRFRHFGFHARSISHLPTAKGSYQSAD